MPFIQGGRLGFIPYSELAELYGKAEALRESLERTGLHLAHL